MINAEIPLAALISITAPNSKFIGGECCNIGSDDASMTNLKIKEISWTKDDLVHWDIYTNYQQAEYIDYLLQDCCTPHEMLQGVHSHWCDRFDLNQCMISEWVIIFISLSGDSRQQGPYSPYKPCNRSLYIGIIMYDKLC